MHAPSTPIGRRQFLMNAAVVGAAGALPSAAAQAQTTPALLPRGGASIRPFRVNVPQSTLTDLRRRILDNRWPEEEPVTDASQGVQLATLRKLADYWAMRYDWRKCERRLNALPQFITEIDGIDIHFIHVKSRHPDALPMIVTHGWPGSVIEQLKIIDPLTNPTAHGADPADAFDVVIPSMPGYGFSGKPAETGWNSDRMARAWDVLMKRLGYTRYVSQGGDWGARVAEAQARQKPEGLLGIHMNLLLSVPPEITRAINAGDPAPAGLSADEKIAFDQRKALFPIGYYTIQGKRPQTVGYALAQAPVGLAAWLIDHDAVSLEKIAGLFDGKTFGAITRDDILDNITLYWVTNTATSAGRLYWEQGRTAYMGEVTVPAAFTVFPSEVYRAPRSWMDRTFRNVIHFNEVSEGGHFAAWEVPDLFSRELRTAFRGLR